MRGTVVKKIKQVVRKQLNQTIDAFSLFISGLGFKARIKLCYRIILKKKENNLMEVIINGQCG